MTNLYENVKQDLSANPLFSKLRNRFMCQNNCTIGEVMLRKAESDGYKCSANVSSSIRSKSNFTMTREFYITRANTFSGGELCKSEGEAKKGKNGLLCLIAMFMLCTVMLAYLVLNRVNYVKDVIDTKYSEAQTETGYAEVQQNVETSH